MSNSSFSRGRLLCATLMLVACSESTVQVVSEEPAHSPDLAGATVIPISGNGQEGTVGEVLPSPLIVAVVDSGGSPIEGAPVLWTARGDTTSLETTTDENGLTSIHWQLGPVAGEQLLVVEIGEPEKTAVLAAPLAAPKDGSGRSTTIKARGKPSRPDRILTSHASLELEVGETVVVTATVVDKFGNVIPDAVIEWSSSDPSVATVSPAATASVRVAEE